MGSWGKRGILQVKDGVETRTSLRRGKEPRKSTSTLKKKIPSLGRGKCKNLEWKGRSPWLKASSQVPKKKSLAQRGITTLCLGERFRGRKGKLGKELGESLQLGSPKFEKKCTSTGRRKQNTS